MKFLGLLGKTILYSVLALFICAIVLTSVLYYRLVYKEQAFTADSINFNYSSLSIKAESVSLSFDKASKTLTAKAGGSSNIYYQTQPVLTTSQWQMTASFDGFFHSFSIPITIDIGTSHLFIAPLATSLNNTNQARTEVSAAMLEAHSFLNNLSRKKFIFVQGIKIDDSEIAYKNLNYVINFTSSLNDMNQFAGTINLKTSTANSQMQLTINNQNKQITTKLVFDYFPVELLTSLIPEKYYIKILDNADDGAIMTGQIKYLIDSSAKKNILSANLINKAVADIKNAHSIDQFKINVTTDDRLKQIDIKNLSLKLTNAASLKMNATITDLPKLVGESLQISSNIEARNIPINSMDILWPQEILPPARTWLIDNMHNGIAEKITCNLNIKDISDISPQDIAATILFKNIDLTYDEEYEQLTNLNGLATFDAHSVKINVDSGQLLSAIVDHATVEIIYDDAELPLIVTADTHGNGKNYLSYIGKNNLAQIESMGLELAKIDSTVIGKVYLKIPLQGNTSLANIALDVNASLANTSVAFRNNIQVSEAALELHVTNKEVKISGSAKINSQPANVMWLSNFDNINAEIFDHKLNISTSLSSNQLFERSIGDNFQITSGNAKGELEYIAYPKTETLVTHIDLANANFTIPGINLVKNNDQPCAFDLTLNSGEDKIWRSTKLELISPNNINIAGAMELEPGLANIRNFVGNFKFLDNSFNLDYQNIDNNLTFTAVGSKLDLRQVEVLNLLKPGSHQYDRTIIKLDLKNITMANDATLLNVKGDFDCTAKDCSAGSLNANMNNAVASVKMVKPSKQLQWKIHTNDAATFLKAFRIYKNIKGGELNVTLTKINSDKPGYKGEAEMTGFTATKTPILAKLISFSSFRGILSILRNYRSIPFKKMHGCFTIHGDDVKIEQTYFTGDYITLTLAGTIDLNKKYVNFHGKVVPPVYGFNYALSLLPFVGHQLAGEDGKKGLIAADYSIKGPLDDTKTFVNPLGIFVPQIFMGLLVP